MKLSIEQQRRVEQVVGEMQELFGGERHGDGRAKTFDELEEECVAVGDEMTRTLLQRRLVVPPGAHDGACCPDCQRLGQRQPSDEPRIINTTRGEVESLEPDYYCPRCRRSFFPSVG